MPPRGRGALIAFEGLDRAGKSSQCAAAAAALLLQRRLGRQGKGKLHDDDGEGAGDAEGGGDVRVLRFPGA